MGSVLLVAGTPESGRCRRGTGDGRAAIVLDGSGDDIYTSMHKEALNDSEMRGTDWTTHNAASTV